MVQTALRWLMQKPAVPAPILGAGSLARLKDNLGAVGWKLGEGLMKRLDGASTAVGPYPYDEAGEKQQREGCPWT